MIPGLVAHLWQSTLFAGVAWLLTLALRNNPAQVRYRIWFIASVKFLIPFSLLVGLGTLVPRAAAPPIQSGWMTHAEQIARPLIAFPIVTARVAVMQDGADRNYFAASALALWACGFLAIAICWLNRWKRVRAMRQSAVPVTTRAELEFALPVMSAPGLAEPGVFGIFRPALLLPEGIDKRLAPAQLDAILAHELCHVRRRDNLTATVHMAAQAIFWFHPCVWWLGSRLVHERERACDEEVLRRGSKPQVYAAGILNVCRLYVEMPLACVSGVTGADLKKRIEAIMKNDTALRLNFAKKSALVVTGVLALALPFVVGALNAPAILAQPAQAAPDSALTFEVASIRPLKSREGAAHYNVLSNRLDVKNMSLQYLIRQAWNVRDDQVSAPDWLSNHGYDIAATSGVAASPAAMRTMLKNLLIERFQLTTHWETRTKAMYRLVALPTGPKMKTAEQGYALANSPFRDGSSIRIAGEMSMWQLAERLSTFAGRPVVDATNLDGYFTVALTFSSDDAGPADNGPLSPRLSTAVQEQLGLRLVPETGQIDILVVDRAEPVPTAN